MEAYRERDAMGRETLIEREMPHASDCAVWVEEPCDCITGKEPEDEMERARR